MQSVAIIFAGGTGQRMNTRARPKQFLELHGKPIIIYTLEQFEYHNDIDGIVVVCVEGWIPFLEKALDRFGITKVKSIVPGGVNGQASIRNGVQAAVEHFGSDAVVLVHDGVRPLVDSETISACIAKTADFGSAVTVASAIETIVKEDGGRVSDIIDRSTCMLARAPQCFMLGELHQAHIKAVEDGLGDFIDSASLMKHYGHELYLVEGKPENIKITTPSDFYIFRALVDAKENSQIFG